MPNSSRLILEQLRQLVATPSVSSTDPRWDQGNRAVIDLLAGWLPRLQPNGVAILVVQKHLGADSLQKWLIDHGHPTTRIASRAGFRLLRVTAPT